MRRSFSSSVHECVRLRRFSTVDEEELCDAMPMLYQAEAFAQEDRPTDVTGPYDGASSCLAISTRAFGKRGNPLPATPVTLAFET